MPNNKAYVKLEISSMLKYLKQNDLMLYPVMMFLLAKAVNSEKCRFHTCYQTLTEKLDWLPYQDDFAAFYRQYLSRGLYENFSSLKFMPKNIFYVTFKQEDFEKEDLHPAILVSNFSEAENTISLTFKNFENHAEIITELKAQYENFFKSL